MDVPTRFSRPHWPGLAASLSCLALLPLLLAAGCASSKPAPPPRPLGWTEMRPVLANARDPRRLGLTVYDGRDGPVLEGAYRSYESQAATLAWSRKSTLPVLDIDVGALSALPVLIDSSAPDNWISLAVGVSARCEVLGPPLYQRGPDHVAQEIPGFLTLASRVRLFNPRDTGVVIVDRVPFYMLAAVGSLGEITRLPASASKVPQAVLGAEFLRGFSFVKFDFPNRSIFFSSTERFPRHPRNMEVSLPLIEHRGAIAVEALLDDRRTRLVIDTAGDFEIVTDSDRIDAVDLQLDSLLIRDAIVTPAIDARVSPAYEARIGLGLLRDYILVLDFKNRMLHLGSPVE